MTGPTVRHASYIKMTPQQIARSEARRWTQEFFRESGFNPWSYIGGIVTVLVLEFVFIAVVL